MAKTKLKPGIKSKAVYRDAFGRFATKENAVSDETWKYRETVKGKVKHVKITPFWYQEKNTTFFRSIQVARSGQRMGKISAALSKTLEQIGTDKHDSLLEISMTAKTSHGKRIKRKISFYHYNTKELHERTIGKIVESLFYEYGDRPAYPIKIVKEWRGRESSKREAQRRRQLHNVTFTVKATIESRKKKKSKKNQDEDE